MIEVRNLQLSISGRPILADINFTLEDGHNLIILGRSGSGKTVLIKTLMGFFRPDKGSVVVDGKNVYDGKSLSAFDLEHDFAMVFQNSALLDSFTIYQNVALPLYERGELERSEILAKVKHCLGVVGLESTMDKYPSELSGGMRKRIGIARALIYDPKYIIFDEPVSGLDPITSSEVLFYITQIIKSVRATTITITHDIRNLEAIGDQVLFLESGKTLFYGPVKEMHASDNHLLRQFLNVSH